MQIKAYERPTEPVISLVFKILQHIADTSRPQFFSSFPTGFKTVTNFIGKQIVIFCLYVYTLLLMRSLSRVFIL